MKQAVATQATRAKGASALLRLLLAAALALSGLAGAAPAWADEEGEPPPAAAPSDGEESGAAQADDGDDAAGEGAAAPPPAAAQGLGEEGGAAADATGGGDVGAPATEPEGAPDAEPQGEPAAVPAATLGAEPGITPDEEAFAPLVARAEAGASDAADEGAEVAPLAAGDSLGSAVPYTLGTTVNGAISIPTDAVEADFFGFTLASSGRLSLVFDTESLERAKLFVYDIDGIVGWWNGSYFLSKYWGELGWNETAKKANLRSSLWLNSGTYRFCVEKYEKYTGAYSFSLSFESSNESFKEGYLGSDNTFAAAKSIALGRTYRGQLSHAADPADFYAFTLASAGVVTIRFDTQSFEDATLLVYGIDGAVVWKSRSLGWDNVAKKASYRASIQLKRGAYRFCVEKYYINTGAYSFKLEKAKIHTVKLSANGGKLRKGAASSVKRSHGTELGRLATPTRTGHDFQGWYTAKAGGRKVATTTKVTKNVTLYAHWKARAYTVRLDANGGKVKGWYSVTTVKRAYGSKLGRLAVPKRSGYKFQGWYTGKHGGKRVGSATRVTKAVTLYAHWKRVR